MKEKPRRNINKFATHKHTDHENDNKSKTIDNLRIIICPDHVGIVTDRYCDNFILTTKL